METDQSKLKCEICGFIFCEHTRENKKEKGSKLNNVVSKNLSTEITNELRRYENGGISTQEIRKKIKRWNKDLKESEKALQILEEIIKKRNICLTDV